MPMPRFRYLSKSDRALQNNAKVARSFSSPAACCSPMFLLFKTYSNRRTATSSIYVWYLRCYRTCIAEFSFLFVDLKALPI